MYSIAGHVIASLRASGVHRLYGLAGDSLNGLTDSVRRDGEVEWVHVRHEESAAFAAAADEIFLAKTPRGVPPVGRYFTFNGRRRLIGSFNNGSLNFVELEVKAAGIINFATEPDSPRLAEVAEAIGLRACRVERPGGLEDALNGAFAHDGPAPVEVMTARQELSVPPAITAEQAKGFTLYAIRTVLSGRGGELLDLVPTNVARRILHRSAALPPRTGERPGPRGGPHTRRASLV